MVVPLALLWMVLQLKISSLVVVGVHPNLLVVTYNQDVLFFSPWTSPLALHFYLTSSPIISLSFSRSAASHSVCRIALFNASVFFF